MGLLHPRDEESSRIRAAKINASCRDRINDVLAESSGILFIANKDAAKYTPDFFRCFPLGAAQVEIWIGGPFKLSVAASQIPKHIAHGQPVASLGRGEEFS